MRSIGTTVCALLCCTAGALAAAAEDEARIELRIGAVALYLPDYPGANHYDFRFLPFPYAVYHSPKLHVTPEGLRARLFSLESLSVSMSVAASLPGSGSSPARENMPRLLPTFEAGPSLDLQLFTSLDRNLRAKLQFPVRAVIATDIREFERAGWVFEPHLRVDRFSTWEDWKLTLRTSLGPKWSTDDYHDYYYSVPAQFATSARPAYDAPGGYTGTRLWFSSSFNRKQLTFGAYASYDWLHGAAYADSPLFQSEHALLAGLFVTYQLYASGREQPEGADAP